MSGPKVGKFGDVISSSLAFSRGDHAGMADVFGNFQLYVGQIVRIYTVDDPANSPSGQPVFTLYDVLVHHANGSTDFIGRCRMLQPGFGGGINNYEESIPTDPGQDAKNFDKARMLKRGHYVLVGLIEGKKYNGVILGGMPHPNPTAVKRRPKKAQGVIKSREIQGLYEEINNDGEYTVTFNGPRDDQGNLTSTAGPTTLKLDKTGGFTVTTNKNQTVAVNPADGTIALTNGGVQLVMSQDGTVKITGGKVSIGSNSLEAMVKGNTLAKQLGALCDAIAKLQVIAQGTPSSVPVNFSDFLRIKSELKSFLSDKHQVE